MPQQRPSLFRWREIPGSVWILGLVSMFMDVSSEMIHALLPLYLVTVLGASTLTVGIIEGIAEATASITKIFSGALSDYLGRRKWLAGPPVPENNRFTLVGDANSGNALAAARLRYHFARTFECQVPDFLRIMLDQTRCRIMLCQRTLAAAK